MTDQQQLPRTLSSLLAGAHRPKAGADVAQHGSEQQGLEAGFEQEAGRKRLDAGHSQRVVITTGSMESHNAMPTLPRYNLCTALG